MLLHLLQVSQLKVGTLIVPEELFLLLTFKKQHRKYYIYITIMDKICLIEIIGLFIGIMGTVPGHELTHRKKSKLDMFIGNCLLAISWDCTFAVEHVYGHLDSW